MVRLKANRARWFVLLCLCSCQHKREESPFQNPLLLQQQQIQAQYSAAQSNAKTAEDAFRASLYQDTGSKKYLMAMGNQALQQRDPKKAEKYFKRALKVAPADPIATNNLVMIYMSKGKNLNRARKLVEESLPSAGIYKPHLLNTLANIRLMQGHADEAQYLLNQAQATTQGSEDPQLQQELSDTSQRLNPSK